MGSPWGCWRSSVPSSPPVRLRGRPASAESRWCGSGGGVWYSDGRGAPGQRRPAPLRDCTTARRVGVGNTEYPRSDIARRRCCRGVAFPRKLVLLSMALSFSGIARWRAIRQRRRDKGPPGPMTAIQLSRNCETLGADQWILQDCKVVGNLSWVSRSESPRSDVR